LSCRGFPKTLRAVVDDEAFVRRQREKGEHVTARQRRNEGRLGVNALWIAQIGGHGRSWRLDADFEAPNMITAIIFVPGIGAITLPFDHGFVVSFSRCDPERTQLPSNPFAQNSGIPRLGIEAENRGAGNH
jgi:hypothetical protein